MSGDMLAGQLVTELLHRDCLTPEGETVQLGRYFERVILTKLACTVYGNTGEEKKCLPWASASHAHALEAYDQAGSGESTGVVARVWKESMRWHEPAMRELLQGAKTGHWIWHVFPTHVRHAAGSKSDSAMRSLAEAREYLSHPKLRRNYLEVSCGTGYLICGAGTAYTNKRSCAHAHTYINSRHA
jgi:hypothetical protein